MRRCIRSLVAGSAIVLCVAVCLLVSADAAGNNDMYIVSGPASSVTATATGVNVCVADPASRHALCGQTTTEKANGFGLHVGRCVLIEGPRGVVVGVTSFESEPCVSQ